jgi:hypothetical protein
MRAIVLYVACVLTACTASAAPIVTSESPADETLAQPVADAAPTASPTATPEPTPVPPPTYWPLRGTVAPNAAAVDRRPIVVRLGNDIAARPQSGFSEADVVWEMLVEGFITRYALVFHSTDAAQVGPVRSARLSDLHFTPMLRGVLAHVGAAHPVMLRIAAAASKGAFIDVDELYYGRHYQRVSWRFAPQNVYTSTQRLREAAVAAGDRGNVQVPALPFGTTTPGLVSTAAVTTSTLTVPYAGYAQVSYAFDTQAGAYRRTQNGSATVDAANGRPVLATNVVVIGTDIWSSDIIEDRGGSRSLEIRSTGTGPVSVFCGGWRWDGTWTRAGEEMYRFADASGAPIVLCPGQTWVHVIPASWAITTAP